MSEIALGNARQRGGEVVGNFVGGHGDAACKRTTFIDVTVGGGVSFARRGDPSLDQLRSKTRRLLRRLMRRQSQGSLQVKFQERIHRRVGQKKPPVIAASSRDRHDADSRLGRSAVNGETSRKGSRLAAQGNSPQARARRISI